MTNWNRKGNTGKHNMSPFEDHTAFITEQRELLTQQAIKSQNASLNAARITLLLSAALSALTFSPVIAILLLLAWALVTVWPFTGKAQP